MVIVFQVNDMAVVRLAKFFDEEIYPESGAELVGYAWLINEYELSVPAPYFIGAIVPAKNAKRSKGRWLLRVHRLQKYRVISKCN